MSEPMRRSRWSRRSMPPFHPFWAAVTISNPAILRQASISSPSADRAVHPRPSRKDTVRRLYSVTNHRRIGPRPGRRPSRLDADRITTCQCYRAHPGVATERARTLRGIPPGDVPAWPPTLRPQIRFGEALCYRWGRKVWGIPGRHGCTRQKPPIISPFPRCSATILGRPCIMRPATDRLCITADGTRVKRIRPHTADMTNRHRSPSRTRITTMRNIVTGLTSANYPSASTRLHSPVRDITN